MIKCPNPSCNRRAALYVRDAFAWDMVQTWRGMRLRRVKVGECAVCLGCDTPFVVLKSGEVLLRYPLRAPAQRDTGNGRMSAEAMLGEFEKSLNLGREEP